jgi:hypothetical protein
LTHNLTLAALALLVVSCTASEPEVEFIATPLSVDEWNTWSHAGVQSAHREITVRRTIRTPSACRTLDADVAQVGHEITLRIVARKAKEDGCSSAGEGLFGYMAVLRGLRPGRYDLRVVHVFANPDRPAEVALRHSVLVED